MKPLIVGLTVLLLATAAQADIRHEGGPKASDGAPGEGEHNGGNGIENDPRYNPNCQCAYGRLTLIGTDLSGNPSQDTPGLGPDWDPHRDDLDTPDDPNTDWGWDE